VDGEFLVGSVLAVGNGGIFQRGSCSVGPVLLVDGGDFGIEAASRAAGAGGRILLCSGVVEVWGATRKGTQS